MALTKIKNCILTGIVVVIPAFLSLWVAWTIYSKLTEWAVGCFISLPVFKNIQPALAEQIIRISSLLFLFLALFFIGALTKLTLGKKLLDFTQKILLRLPIVSFVYSTVKQIGDAIQSSKSGNMFHQVVMIEYPRKGCWTVGFLTNDNRETCEVTEKLPSQMITVFVPTTPNPTSGFMFYAPREECIFLDMTPSEAMRLIVSCGTVTKFEHVKN